MKKEDYIKKWGKKAYLIEMEKNKLRNRASRGYTGDNRGSWERVI